MTDLMDMHVPQDLAVFVHEQNWSLRGSEWTERNAFDRVDALDRLDKNRLAELTSFERFTSHSVRCGLVFLFLVCGTSVGERRSF